MQTYQLTENKALLIVHDDDTGEYTVTPVLDLQKKREALVNSKQLNIESFDAKIAAVDAQIAFVEASQE